MLCQNCFLLKARIFIGMCHCALLLMFGYFVSGFCHCWHKLMSWSGNWVSLESWYGASGTGGYCVRIAFYCRLGNALECVTALFYWCLDIDFYSTSVITFVSRNCRCSSNLLEENAEAYLGAPRILKFMNCTGLLSVVSEYFDLWEGAAGSEFGIKLGLDMRQKVDLLWFLW